MRIYPIPRTLLTNPYLDQLYSPIEAKIDLRRIPVAQVLRETLKNPKRAIIHWHFFDELLQRPSRLSTAIRSLMFIGLILVLKLRGIKLVWTVHNIEPHEVEHPVWAKRVYRKMATYADGIIVHSQAAAELIQERYNPRTKITVMPQGNYIGVYGSQKKQIESRKSLQLPTNTFIALNLGHIRKYKGIELLIDAWQDTSGKLLIAGNVKDSAYGDTLQLQAQNKSNIELHMKFIPDEDISTWISAANVLVLPYRKLLTSAVLLWAISYATPVIAPDVSTVRELLKEGETGFLFEPGNVESLHQALQRAAQHPNLEEMGQNAYNLALSFPWEKSANILYELYGTILHHNKIIQES